MTNRHRLVAVLALASLISTSGCAKGLAELLKGAWTITAMTCDGTDILTLMIPSGATGTITFDATAATMVISDSDCTKTSNYSSTYAEDGKSATMTDGATTCSVASCALGTAGTTTCTAEAASSSATAEIWTTALSNGDKTVTATVSTDCNGSESSKETLSMTLTKN